MIRVNSDQLEFTDDYLYQLYGHPFTGMGYDLDDQDSLIAEVEFQDGMQHGATRFFYPGGQLKREAYLQYNTLDGFVREWDENGVLEREEKYEKGICLWRKALSSSGQMAIVYELTETSPLFNTLQLLREARSRHSQS